MKMAVETRQLILSLFVQIWSLILVVRTTARHDYSQHPLRVIPEIFPHAAVASDNRHCSLMGKEVLQRNGSAVDAAMVTLLCLTVVKIQSVGIAGGGHMIIYKRSTGKAEVIDFKECAPSGIKDEDFKKPWKKGQYYIDPKLQKGGKSIGVPGLLKGLELAHRRHGKLPWQDIFESVAQLAENEHRLDKFPLQLGEEDLELRDKTQFKEFRSFLASVKIRKNQAFSTNPSLAKTFRTLAKAGNAAPFYDGILSKIIIKDIQKNNGTMTLEDLKNYRAILREPVKIKLDGNTMYSAPPPAGGMVVSLILNVLKGYNFSKHDIDDNGSEKTSKLYHKMIESCKWSFANIGLLGDPQFPLNTQAKRSSSQNPKSRTNTGSFNQDIKKLLTDETGAFIRRAISNSRTYNISHYNPDVLIGKLDGTTHVSVLAPNGDAVGITVSNNDLFGSYVFSKDLGSLFNNQVKDFREYGQIAKSCGQQQTALNVIVPGKRVPSLMSPSVMVDKNNNVVMVVGASGGTRIPPIMSQVIAKYLWLEMDFAAAMNMPRFHHQLFPNKVFIEENLSREIQTKLKEFGHEISEDIASIAHYRAKNLAKLNALVVKRTRDSNKISIHAMCDDKSGGPHGY